MRCTKCGEELAPKTSLYSFEDEYLGTISVVLNDSHECEGCGEIFLSLEDAECIEKAQEEALEELLQSRPISNYFTQKETAEILGISKQAVSKNRRIRRGFIFQTEFDGRKMYLKDSVYLYKENGDGRFLLVQGEKPVRMKYRVNPSIEPLQISGMNTQDSSITDDYWLGDGLGVNFGSLIKR